MTTMGSVMPAGPSPDRNPQGVVAYLADARARVQGALLHACDDDRVALRRAAKAMSLAQRFFDPLVDAGVLGYDLNGQFVFGDCAARDAGSDAPVPAGTAELVLVVAGGPRTGLGSDAEEAALDAVLERRWLDFQRSTKNLMDPLHRIKVALRSIADSSTGNEAVRLALEGGADELLATFEVCVASFALVVKSAAPTTVHFHTGLEAVESARETIAARELMDVPDPVAPVREAFQTTKEVAFAFLEHAEVEDKRANRVRSAAVLAALSISGFEYYASTLGHGPDAVLGIDPSRVVIALPVAVVAAYLGREASRHRIAAYRDRLLGAQLDKLEVLDGLERSAWRDWVSRHLFARPMDPKISQIDAPDVLGEVRRMAETVKADKSAAVPKKEKKRTQGAAG